ncbi:hypothetical protein [Pectobacterium polaris]|uniref:hypothetical protein n=1 Tax=Pectobacterium polaris TaxID=2042057 RepID=UPI0024049F01|nr:hypothetical protein [Pectobacterium polaris]MDG0800092.1 hypothetical protein [Pectobacterium polaris]
MLKAAKSVLFDILSMILTFIFWVISLVMVTYLLPENIVFPAFAFCFIGSMLLSDYLVDKLR